MFFTEPYIGCIVLVLVFVSALLGRLIRRRLPESHLDNQTEAVVKLAMGVVGTLTALVLGLLVATANGSFTASSQEVTSIAANVIRLDHLLRRYGPEADGIRDLLRRYTAKKLQDLFPEGSATMGRSRQQFSKRSFPRSSPRHGKISFCKISILQRRPIQWLPKLEKAASKVIPLALGVLIATGSKTKAGLASRTAGQMKFPLV